MISNPGVSDFLLSLFIATPFGVLFYMLWLCWTRGHDPERYAISAQYEPPDNLTPGECGTLMDNAVALRSITATITDLSVKGYLAIEQKDNSESPSHHQDYIFRPTKPPSDWDDLKAHERAVLKSIFIPTNPLLMLSEAMSRLKDATGNARNAVLSSVFSGVEAKARETSELYRSLSGAEDSLQTSVLLSELQNHFYLHLATIRDALFDRLVASGYYAHRPDRVRQVFAVKGFFGGS